MSLLSLSLFAILRKRGLILLRSWLLKQRMLMLRPLKAR